MGVFSGDKYNGGNLRGSGNSEGWGKLILILLIISEKNFNHVQVSLKIKKKIQIVGTLDIG